MPALTSKTSDMPMMILGLLPVQSLKQKALPLQEKFRHLSTTELFWHRSVIFSYLFVSNWAPNGFLALTNLALPSPGTEWIWRPDKLGEMGRWCSSRYLQWLESELHYLSRNNWANTFRHNGSPTSNMWQRSTRTAMCQNTTTQFRTITRSVAGLSS